MRKTHTEIHLRNEPEHGHKEYKYLYQQMLKDDVIRKAYKKLRKGKTKRKEIQYIDAHLDDEVQKMYDMILNTKPKGLDVPHPELAYKPKKRTPKIIFEHGKRRKIYMPEIHEQWLHHIIVLVLEPIITATACTDTYDCYQSRIKPYIHVGRLKKIISKIKRRQNHEGMDQGKMLRGAAGAAACG